MPKKTNKAVRQVLPKLHIFCEGAKTEPNYIEKYLQLNYAGDRRKSLVRIQPTTKNTPLELVGAAILHKNSQKSIKGDIFWVVYDREAVAKYKDATHLEASQRAVRNGINIALSNVCFELWILLHFRNNAAPYSSFADLMANSKLKSDLLAVGVEKYDKADSILFDIISGNIGIARDRAIQMNAASIAVAAPGVVHPHLLNPYTDMHLLLDEIDKFI